MEQQYGHCSKSWPSSPFESLLRSPWPSPSVDSMPQLLQKSWCCLITPWPPIPWSFAVVPLPGILFLHFCPLSNPPLHWHLSPSGSSVTSPMPLTTSATSLHCSLCSSVISSVNLSHLPHAYNLKPLCSCLFSGADTGILSLWLLDRKFT